MKDAETGVRIGCFGGFWGDSMAHAVGQFLRSREAEAIDYLVSDYLAEVTMCILAKKKKAALAAQAKAKAAAAKGAPSPGAGSKGPQRVATAGGIDDFALGIWRPFGQMLMEKGIKVVVNAGGLDPIGLKAAVEAISEKFPAEHRPKVAAVVGDDLLGYGGDAARAIAASMAGFKLDGGSTMDGARRPSRRADGTTADLPTAPLSSNAYIGCGGIVKALQSGAHVVITGRVVDSAMVLGPLAFEHGWDLQRDFDRLAAGTLAGHVIECGAQCTGGNFTDWELALQRRGRGARLFENIGFPLVEVAKDGSFVVTKPSGTGGIVSRLSVSEQLVYEIGDPRAYIVADVVCDFSNAVLEEVAKNRVRVTGVRGRPATGCYKVTSTYSDGYTGHFNFAIVGPNALYKARAVAESLVRRSKRTLAQMGQPPYRAVRIEYLGAREMTVNGGDSRRGTDTAFDEVVCRISVHHENPKLVMLVAANIPSGSTGMAPGLFALSTARPTPSESVALRSSLVPAKDLAVSVVIGRGGAPAAVPPSLVPASAGAPAPPAVTTGGAATSPQITPGATVMAPLYTVACCRSGDKADSANVGVVCRRPEYLPYLQRALTVDVVREHLAAWFDDGAPEGDPRVERFTLPGPAAMNFVLSQVLGGGGLASLKADKQGKCIGSLLSGLKLELPAEWVKDFEEGVGAEKAAIRSKL